MLKNKHQLGLFQVGKKVGPHIKFIFLTKIEQEMMREYRLLFEKKLDMDIRQQTDVFS